MSIGHICGYFGPDPGADKKPRTAKGLLKRMAYCMRQGEKHRGTCMNMDWLYWFGEYGVAFGRLQDEFPDDFARYMAEEEERQKAAPPIELD